CAVLLRQSSERLHRNRGWGSPRYSLRKSFDHFNDDRAQPSPAESLICGQCLDAHRTDLEFGGVGDGVVAVAGDLLT
ncbi:MAG: hypothetical protein OXG88_00815, partial [Gammaproteobacteria bacterium]|nr:hypothetical protein [Gammaproteobacteria bacterium]